MNAYLDALLNAGDFEQFLTDDVQWTTVKNGHEVKDAVRDFILVLRRQLFDSHPEVKNLAIADGIADSG